MNFNESVIVPIILSIVELAKGLGLPKKFSALVAIVVGVLIGIFYIEPQNIKYGLFKGVVYGLSASGLYSGTKNAVEQIRTRNIKCEKQNENENE
jgi:Na+/H+ antiporter NhaC